MDAKLDEMALLNLLRQPMGNHLSGCNGCTHDIEQMRQTIRLTGQVSDETLTPQQRDDLVRLFRDGKKGQLRNP